MKKSIITATVMGLVLVAGQAMASASAGQRVSDRLGARDNREAAVVLPVLLIGAAILAVALNSKSGDEADSD